MLFRCPECHEKEVVTCNSCSTETVKNDLVKGGCLGCV
jgi:predicted RNA-binding Zn-ribbon protein involved in translation (DUF1610 family)